MYDDLPLFPQSASTVSDKVDHLYFFLVATSAFFSILVSSLIVYFAVKYRRRASNVVATQIEGSLSLELLWTIVPFLLSMVMFVWGARLFFTITTPPADVTDIYVVGKQWMWKIQHPQGQREINDLHVPLGQAVRLTMASEDVIHSFYIPAFRTKTDVVPGRYSTTWFQATKTGVYHLFCAEYCGTKHSAMIGNVHVMTPQDYEQWLSGAPAGEPPEEAGRKLFESLRCDSCHKSAPDARGPTLAGLFGKTVRLRGGATHVANEDYLRESILNPMAKIVDGYEPLMPTYAGQLSEEEVLHLIAFLQTMKGAQ